MVLTMFDIFKDIKQELFGKPSTETIVVAKPLCQPSRPLIQDIFKTYGVKLIDYHEKFEQVKHDGELINALILSYCKVSSKQAVWAEYLLLRSHKFMLWSKPKNEKNLEWANRHNVMPSAWNGKPLIEKGCKPPKKQKQHR